MIDILHDDSLIASLKRDREFVLEYIYFDIANLISLFLPNNQKFYISENWGQYKEIPLELRRACKKD